MNLYAVPEADRRASLGAPPLLRLSGVDVAPAVQSPAVLRKVSLELGQGECVALVGPSGSGKTTLLRTIAGLIPARAGTVWFEGRDLADPEPHQVRARRRRIAIVSQQHDLVQSLRVDKNVMAGALGRWSNWRALRFLALARAEELAECEATLEAVGLSGKARRSTASLSGGEQQRVAIARALIQAPALMLADEPIASLDPDTAEAILGLLTRLARSRRMSLICSLHQPLLAERHCDRVLELRDGRLLDRG